MKQVQPGCVSRETKERLETFAELLRHWSRTVNLVSPHDLNALWPRHIADSLQLAPFLQDRRPPLIDLGSGAGFPGLVLSIALNWQAHLVESDRRKAAFLREAARQTNAPATVHAERVESLKVPASDVITARALAPLSKLLSYSEPLLRPDGVCLFLKGRGVDEELTAARAQWHMRVERFPSQTDRDAAILRISEIGRVRHDG